MPQQNSPAAKTAGLALAATGLSHFVAPQIYEGMTKAAFPDNTRTHVYVDGGIETVLGLALAAGCGDSRLGGDDGMNVPGDRAASPAVAKPSTPSLPDARSSGGPPAEAGTVPK